jgi:hypothetical protein
MGPARMRESLTTTPGIRERPRPVAEVEHFAVLHNASSHTACLSESLEDVHEALTLLIRSVSMPKMKFLTRQSLTNGALDLLRCVRRIRRRSTASVRYHRATRLERRAT